MLTPQDIEGLDALARDLARRRFAGEASVGRRSSGLVRLIIVKHEHGGGSLYRERDVAAVTYEAATREIAQAVQWAVNP